MDKENKIINIIENSYYENEELDLECCWEEKLKEYFHLKIVENYSEYDNHNCYSFIIALNNQGLFSEATNLLLLRDDAYFIDIDISRDKPLVFMCFMKYNRGSLGQEADFSETPFLEEQRIFYKKFISFVEDNNLILLTKEDMKKRVKLEGKEVSIYYKYFSQIYVDPLYVPY